MPTFLRFLSKSEITMLMKEFCGLKRKKGEKEGLQVQTTARNSVLISVLVPIL
jgi:hypothetical protein